MKKLLSIFLLLLVSVVVFAQNNFNPKDLLSGAPSKQQLVNDYSNVLTSDQKQALENKLDVFDDSTTSQIAVVIIPNLGDYDVSDYATQLGRAWGIGSKKNNNGVVFLVCTDPNNHKINISPGYGLEGALPDITCKEIIDDIVVPSFKGNDYYGGIDQGKDAIIKATKGEYTAPEGNGKQVGGLSLARIIFLIIVIIVFLSIVGRGGGGGFFTGMLLGNLMGGGGRGGDWGGGGGGGGFGGFGGGSFGGGGASGSW